MSIDTLDELREIFAPLVDDIDSDELPRDHRSHDRRTTGGSVNPKAFALIALAVIVGLAILIGLGYWLVTRNAGVRRREYAAMRTERNNAWRALNTIEDHVAQYSDLDSVLAAKIRPVIRQHNEEKMDITR